MSAATFAIYAVGCFQLPFLYIVNESVGAVMIPTVSRLQLENQPGEIVRLVARMMRKLAALYFPLYACLLVTGREFVTVLFTESYRASWPIFAVTLTLIPLCILTAACDPVLRAYPAYTSVLVRIRVALIAVLVSGLWIVTAHHWLLGAIVVMVGVAAIDRFTVSVMLGRVLDVTWRDLRLFGDIAKLAAAMSASIDGASHAAPRNSRVLTRYVATIRRAAKATSPFATEMISSTEVATARKTRSARPWAWPTSSGLPKISSRRSGYTRSASPVSPATIRWNSAMFKTTRPCSPSQRGRK